MKKLVYFSLVVFVFVLAYVLIASFLRRGEIQEHTLKYQTSIPLLLGKGQVFYAVQVDDFSFPIQIDKLTFIPQKNKNRVEIDKLTIPVLEILKDKQKQGHLNLEKYIPYRDILLYPMETLALMDIENVSFDGHCNIMAYQEKWTEVSCEFYENALGPIEIQLICTTEYNTSLEKMICPEIKVSLKQTSTLEKYQVYASFIGYEKILKDKKDIIFTLISNGNFYLKDIFQNKDFSFEIRKVD